MQVKWMYPQREIDFFNGKIEEASNKVIRSGNYYLGQSVTDFEVQMKELYGTQTLFCSNGTDAITLALLTEDFQNSNMEVILPSYTFVATIDAVIRAGCKPIFVDVDPISWTIDMNQVKEKINEKTAAVIGTTIFGHTIEWEKIKGYNVISISDSAQSFACHLKSKVKPDYETISFHYTKNLGACGDAGMVVLHKNDLYSKMKKLRIHGMGSEKYYYNYIGGNFRGDTLQAEILIEKYKKYDELHQRRLTIAKMYNHGIKDISTNYCKSENYHQFVLKFNDPVSRDKMKEKLEKNQIATCVFYPIPLHKQSPIVKYCDYSLPISENLCYTTLAIPISPFLTDDEVQHVINVINK